MVCEILNVLENSLLGYCKKHWATGYSGKKSSIIDHVFSFSFVKCMYTSLIWTYRK